MPATMETPLDVLSRAASMVETHEAREAALKRSMDRRDSPPKELPTKFLKYRRMKERGDLAAQLGYDEEHAERCSKRCAGTQTPYINFSQDPAAVAYAHYQKQRGEQSGYVPAADVLDLDRARHQGPGSPASGSAATATHMHGAHVPREQDTPSIPLNLSLSAGSHQYHQPTAPCATGGHHMSNGHDAASGEYRTRRREVTQVEVSDPVIEEHFRRSLGKNYPECLARNPQLPSSSSSPAATATSSTAQSHDRSPPPPERTRVTPVSVTGTVDDHFAKSLGSEWTKIKARQEPASTDTTTGGSVDDHFAKALGDTWFKIKAEKEGSASPSLSPASSPPSPGKRSSASAP